MDINDRLRAAFDEYADSPEPKPSTTGLATKWQIHAYMLQACLSLMQLRRLNEDGERRPLEGYRPQPEGSTGRPRVERHPNQREVVDRFVAVCGGVAQAKARLLVSTVTFNRYRAGSRGIPSRQLEIMRNTLASITEVDKVSQEV